MKSWQNAVSLVLSALCLILAVSVVYTGKKAQELQMQAQRQQSEINSGLLSQNGQQLGGNVLKDMATVAVKNQRMLKLLADNGYSITVNQSPSAATNAAASPKNSRKVTP